jgi:hypothetical protein
MLVERDVVLLFDLEMLEQQSRPASVLAGHVFDLPQDLQRAQRDVGQIADGRCDQVEH